MQDWVRANVRAMAGYTPGEQPQAGEFIKLNTNENPYPPSPRVIETIHRVAESGQLRKYPDPLGTEFRQTAGRVLGIDPNSILIGNGSDDILTIITRTLAPEGGLIVSPTPSYSLYESLAEIQGARCEFVPFDDRWRIDVRSPKPANVTFLSNPNSPSGTMLAPAELRNWPAAAGPLVIDEAYADFADSHCLELATTTKQFIVTRSLSKSYSLAGLRFGLAVAAPELVREFYKVKDSYNCDALSLAAAAAAIEDQAHMLANRVRILATRRRLTTELRRLGFEVLDSQANFVWCRRTDRPVRPIYQELKRRMILVRYMNYTGYGEGLRITIGTDGEIDRLLAEMRAIVK